MRALFSFLLLAACLAGPAHADAPSRSADVAAIEQVVERFKAAILAHDGKTLDGLFLADHDSWLEVADERTWAEVKRKHPEARKVVVDARRKFVEFVQHGTRPVEERFYNVRIETNGAIGMVYFDFDFIADGKVNNRGSETWQMVRAEDGWKIAAMLYSIGK